jgi:lysophospholipase L1-like esterase
MIDKVLWFAGLIICFSVEPAIAQVNTGFESGLAGWTTSGTAVIDNSNMKEGTKCVRIGAGAGGVYQCVNADPLAILWFNAYIKVSSNSNSGFLTVRFYDRDSTLLMEQKSKEVTGISYQERNFYTETPARTKYLQIGIESTNTNTGFVYGDNFSQVLFTPGFENPPQCNPEQYMKPFWSSDTIYSETILMYQKSGSTEISGKLMFTPKNIISVKNFGQSVTYSKGTDFTVTGRTIIKTGPSAMPYSKQSDLDFSNYNWNNLQSKWITVDYTPDRSDWKGPVFGYKGDKMPGVMQKLKNRQPVTLVALGMSITRGLNVSGYGGDNAIPACPPYMPGYVSLFAQRLSKIYGYNGITALNASLPGSTSDWAAKYADKYVNPYEPDLVILDMGMNDFWSFSAGTFKANILATIARIRADCPNAEFMLLSNMLFDPEYLTSQTALSNYIDLMKGYNKALQSLESTGIVNLDMTTMSDSIYQRKKPKDCVVNPLHPNDYIARWYAQGMVALLDAGSQSTAGVSMKTANPDFLNVYPNPVIEGSFTINMDAPDSKNTAEISIWDMQGRQVSRFRQNESSGRYCASGLKLNQGIYLIMAQSGEEVVARKVLIK